LHNTASDEAVAHKFFKKLFKRPVVSPLGISTSTMHQSPLIKDLRSAVGGENVISAPSELAVYDCDAYVLSRRAPEAAVFPQSAEQVAEVVKICNRHGAAIVPRGGGTSLAGGCLPMGRSVAMLLTRMNRVLEVSLRDRWAVVEAGVQNSLLNKVLAGTGFFFAAEPSTQGASTIGGNAATDSSGCNSLKYGTAVNNILGLEAVLGDGSIVQLGPADDPASFDLVGLLVGSEGTLAIATKIWLRLTVLQQDYRTTQVTFDSVDDAVKAVTQILAASMIPTAMELMNRGVPAASNGAIELDLAPNNGAMLLIEIDGLAAGLDRRQEQITVICKKNNAKEVRQASSAEDREMLWQARKSAIFCAGLISPTYIIEDIIVPRTQLPQMLQKIAQIGQRHQVRIISIAHAGEGNVHPVILYVEHDRVSIDRALAASRQLLDECIALGGSVTAEHGVGMRKVDFMPRQYQPADLNAMEWVKTSFDPYGGLNPGKLLPAQVSGLNVNLFPRSSVGTHTLDAASYQKNRQPDSSNYVPTPERGNEIT
jgi:glycolate oxidase